MSFSGNVVLVSTLEQDALYSRELCEYQVVGVDFEWKADSKGESNPLSLVQVCTRRTCYIWLLYRFPNYTRDKAPPEGLQELLRNEDVLKIGCSLRSNDLKKLAISGFRLPLSAHHHPRHHPLHGLPKSFLDVQDFKIYGQTPERKSLKALTELFLERRLPELNASIWRVDWRDVEKDKHLQSYCILDAYAVLEIFYEHEESEKMHQAKEAHIKNQFSDALEYRRQFGAQLSVEEDTSRNKTENMVYTVQFAAVEKKMTMFPTGDSEGEQFHFGQRLRLYSTPSCPNSVGSHQEQDETLFGIPFQVDFSHADGVHYVTDNSKMSDVDHHDTYFMKVEFNPVPFSRMAKALQTWQFGINNLLSSVILGSSPVFQPTDLSDRVRGYTNIAGHELNPSQRDALAFAVSRPFSMIHGPPGTGKTHTLAAIVYWMLKNTDEKILICAPSNDAADNLAMMLIKACKVSTSELVVVKALAKQNAQHPVKLKDYMVHNKTFGMEMSLNEVIDHQKKVIRNTRIICSTLSTSGGFLLSDSTFECVLIDEASQCNEVECLIGIAHGAKRLVLAGDHKQLGPVVLSNTLKGTNFERSMFERLIDIQTHSSKLLQRQYRMHPDISKWPMDTFYEGRVEDGITAMDRQLPMPLHKLFQTPSNPPKKDKSASATQDQRQNMLIHVKGYIELTRFGSSMNKQEADLALALYVMMRKHLSKLEVVILSGYQGQIGYINNQARNQRISTSRIAYTISQFQGREADIVIMSVTRSSNDPSSIPSSHSSSTSASRAKSGAEKTASLGFISEPKRINVALTRAKYLQIIVGDVALLKTHDHWNKAVNFYDSTKTIFVKSSSAASSSTAPAHLPQQALSMTELVQIAASEIPAYAPLGASANAAASSTSPQAPAATSTDSKNGNLSIPGMNNRIVRQIQPSETTQPQKQPKASSSSASTSSGSSSSNPTPRTVIHIPHNVTDVYEEMLPLECQRRRLPKPISIVSIDVPGPVGDKMYTCAIQIGPHLFTATNHRRSKAIKAAAYMAYSTLRPIPTNSTQLNLLAPINAIASFSHRERWTYRNQQQRQQQQQQQQQQRQAPRGSVLAAANNAPLASSRPASHPRDSWKRLVENLRKSDVTITPCYTPTPDGVECTIPFAGCTFTGSAGDRARARGTAARQVLKYLKSSSSSS